MEFPGNNESCGCRRSDCEVCSANLNVCRLCEKEIILDSLSNDAIPFRASLSDNICQCFCSNRLNAPNPVAHRIEQRAELNAPNPVAPRIEQRAQLNAPNPVAHGIEQRAQLNTPNPVAYGTEQRAQLNAPNPVAHRIEQRAQLNVPNPVPHITEQRVQLNVPVCESKPVTLQEKPCIKESSDISNKDFANSSDEKSKDPEHSHSSNGYISSLDELISDQNFSKKGSRSSEEDSRNVSFNTEKGYSSSGYALSLDERLSDQNLASHRSNTSPSSGEGSKKSPKIGKEEINVKSPIESAISTNSECKAGSDGYKASESSPSDQEHKNSNGSNNSSFARKTNKIARYGSSTSSEPVRFHIRNMNIGYPNVRPQLPRPFPTYQPVMTVSPLQPSTYNVQSQNRQPFVPYAYPEFNAPLIGTNIPVRFPLATRPQNVPAYQQNPDTERVGLSKELLALDTEANSIKKKERIENWLHEVVCIPPEEGPPSNSNSATPSTAENEAKEGSPQFFPGTSTDERSSTEKSEEEYLRQRALRRPPRTKRK